MSAITKASFLNFFTYYKGEEHQKKAVEKLFESLPSETLDDEADWVKIYRKQSIDSNEQDEERITKQEMAAIMGCSVGSLSDAVMNDYYTCCRIYKLDRISQAYFLGQVGHESAGLRYPLEIHDGSNYEYRHDLGNVNPGDGVKYAGTGFIQVTGRYWHTEFSRYIADPKVIQEGKQYTYRKYPWSISGYWWMRNDMIDYCKSMPKIDRVGSLVNGRYLPNGYEDRRRYSERAFEVLGIPYPGN